MRKMKTHTLKITDEILYLINMGIDELPSKARARVHAEIQRQLAEQAKHEASLKSIEKAA